MSNQTTILSNQPKLTMPRRNFLRAALALGAVSAAPVYANAAGFLRGAGDIRKVVLRNDRTGEIMDMVYYADGNYIPESMTEVSRFFRDWREDAIKPIDPHAMDVIATTHKMLDTTEPYLLISGYRSRHTNNMVGGASNSYHTRGQAADLRLGSRSVKQMSGAAKSLGAGGVGAYYGQNFVHMDSGPVRSWRG